MNTLWEGLPNHIQNLHLAAFFLDVWLKSLFVLVVAGGVCAVLRRSAAATRYLIWFLALASLLLLPPLGSVLPSWQKPLWSVSSDLVSGNQVSFALELAPLSTQAVPGTNTGPVHTDTPNSGNQSVRSQLFAARFSRDWLPMGYALWCSGVVLALAYLIFGQVQLRNISRTARPLAGGEWTRLLDEACETLRLGRPVTLLQTPDSVMPLTWGWLRPVVLLPAEAEQWPEGRKRIVLLHELAHIKRRDCLTQFVAQIICALYWFNPLVWMAARHMRVEREQACDDLVLNGGCKASEYAGHLVEIASSFRRVPQAAAIAMARRSGLENRVAAIVDASRVRRLRPATVWALLILGGGMLVCVCGWSHDMSGTESADETSLSQQQLNQLEVFSTAKFEQAKILMAADGKELSPEFDRFFQAATNGDWQTVTNMFDSFKQRHPQYARKSGAPVDTNLSTSCWQPALEICLAYDAFGMCDPKYNQIYADEIINSIPPGSIYFGGTDPGRGLPTAFSKSQINADPFYTLTQNALANGNYLDYLRAMYGGKIYTPTASDLEQCFQEYTEDAQKRLENHQLKPGENVSKDANGKVQVNGQVAVMSINGLVAKIIFDRNPNQEFYIEESFPLDWMYPYLEPHRLIMKINRQPLDTLPDDAVQADHAYWARLIAPMIGDWLNDNTSVSDIAAFADKVFARHDFDGFTGDPEFVLNAYSHVMFSKERSSIAGLYAWRAKHATDPVEKQRMNDAADFAFRQALALCPYSPEVVYRYVDLLESEKRISDALLVAQTAANVLQASGPGHPQLTAMSEAQLQDLIRKLQQMQPHEQ
jgi:beta-lactamase regulating signal transducer with metallopeptidase domain